MEERLCSQAYHCVRNLCPPADALSETEQRPDPAEWAEVGVMANDDHTGVLHERRLHHRLAQVLQRLELRAVSRTALRRASDELGTGWTARALPLESLVQQERLDPALVECGNR